MNSRRKLKRVNLISELRVRDAGTSEFIGMTLDINPEGVGLRLRRPFHSGDKLSLLIDLPAEINGTSTM